MLWSVMDLIRNTYPYFARCAVLSLPAVAAALWMHAAVAQTVDTATQDGEPAGEGQQTPVALTAVETAVLRSLLNGDTEAAVRYLTGGGLQAENVSQRAQQLLLALEAVGTGSDPAQVQDVALAISSAVDQALNAVPVFGAQFGGVLTLSQQAIGFDFGTPDSVAAPGFVKVTGSDPRVTTRDGRTLRRPEGVQLQTDGIANIELFQTGLPNGEWRVTLLTDDLGPDQGSAGPFGDRLRLNDQVVTITGRNPGQWIGGALIGSGAEAPAAGAQRGGVIQVTVVVTDGRLVIDFGGATGTYVTGLILQPIEEPNIVRFSGEAARHQLQRTQSANQVRQAVNRTLGQVLSRVASAAGPIQLSQALQVDEIVNQTTAQLSEN